MQVAACTADDFCAVGSPPGGTGQRAVGRPGGSQTSEPFRREPESSAPVFYVAGIQPDRVLEDRIP